MKGSSFHARLVVLHIIVVLLFMALFVTIAFTRFIVLSDSTRGKCYSDIRSYTLNLKTTEKIQRTALIVCSDRLLYNELNSGMGHANAAR